MVGMEPDGKPFRVFLNHGVDIPNEAFEVHGYDREFLEQNGIDPVTAHKQLAEYVGDRFVSAHYLRYDWDQALLPEWHRLGLNQIGKKGLCTWFLARRSVHETPRHKLDLLRDTFDLKCSKAHSAEGDVESTVDLLTRIIFPRLHAIGVKSYKEMMAFSQTLPLMRCLCDVQGKDFATELRLKNEAILRAKALAVEKQRVQDAALAKKLVWKGFRNVRDGIVDYSQVDLHATIQKNHLIDEHEDILFDDMVFIFTGKMKWGTRPQLEKILKLAGGKLGKYKYISPKVDYLVLGEDPLKGWEALDSGKLSDAVDKKLTSPEIEFKIILESDLIPALNYRLQTEPNFEN